jgi:glycosyltransferase involved in cell wall biosynthesis
MSLDSIRGGGTVERTIQMSKSLAKAGHECTILTTDVGFKNEQVDNLPGINIVVFPAMLDRFYVPKLSCASYTQLKKLVQEVDVIHFMGHWIFLNVLVFHLAQRFNKPYVVCPAGELAIYGRSVLIKKIFNLLIGKKIIRNASGHVAIADNEIPRFNEYGIETKRITVIPNGIAVEDLQFHDDLDFRNKYGIGTNPFILFVGRLNPIKGPDLLLSAYNNIQEKKDYHLVFVGPDGGMLTELKNMAAKFEIEDRVHFIGYLGGKEKSQAYYASDLLVIPSRQEAMSIVVLEAGCTGTPVVITNQCGFDEVESIGGGLVVSATVEGLHAGIESILGDRIKLDLMGCKLKDFVYKEFLWSSVVNKYIELYNRILEG